MPDARFVISNTPLPELQLVRRSRIQDERGFLSRLFCANELAAIGFTDPIAQINQTLTHTVGALRGLHFQHPPHAEDKLVICLRGAIFDVAVDLRRRSPTFLRWHGEHLSEDNGHGLFIPKGFAHGFQAMTADSELLYLHTAAYEQAAEGALNALDPALGIEWPLAVTEISARDRGHLFIDSSFSGISL